MDMGAKAKSAISLSSHWQRARPAPSCTLLLPILTIYPRCAHTTPAFWAQWGSGSCQYCPSGLQVHCHGLSPRVHSFLRLQFWNLFLTICLPRWIWFFFFFLFLRLISLGPILVIVSVWLLPFVNSSSGRFQPGQKYQVTQLVDL